MSTDESGIKIENIELGKILYSIKNNDIPLYNPQIISTSHTLTPAEFVNLVTTGILVDCTSSSKTITMPDAASVINILRCKQYDIFIGTIASTANAPFTNQLTIVSSPSIVFAKNVPSVTIASAATGTLKCVCYNNTNSPKIIISF